MTNDDAGALARRVANTFRLTPAFSEWVDVLGPLDREIATATFVKLRDETESGGLSIGRFVVRYREVAASGRRRTDGRCGTCMGERVVSVRPDDPRRHAEYPHDRSRCRCYAVVPCPACAVGHPTPYREEVPIPFDEYLRRLYVRVESGDPGAREELDGWTRARHSWALTGPT